MRTQTRKHLPGKNVTLPWCLVLVPPGWWNVIICTNRKQTGLWVSGCCLFSLSQAQQHWEPDIRLTQLLFSAQLRSPVSVLKYRWRRGTFMPFVKCSLRTMKRTINVGSLQQLQELKSTQNITEAQQPVNHHICYPKSRMAWNSNVWFQSQHGNAADKHGL